MKNTGSRGAVLLIMSAAVLWGLIGPFSVWAAREGMTAVEVAFWRVALAAPGFALIGGYQLRRMQADTVALTALFGLTGIATMYVAFFIAVQRAGVGIAAVLLYTGPAWVALYEWVARRHRPSRISLLALLLTITGVVLVSYLPEQLGRVDPVGIWAGLVSGIAYATHFTLGRRLFARHHPPAVFALAMLVAALAIAPIARPSLPPSSAWIPLLFLSVIATFVASLLFARGVVQVTPVRAAITATIEPVVALAASIIVLHATLHLQQLAGAAFVLAGVTLIMLKGAGADETASATPVSNSA